MREVRKAIVTFSVAALLYAAITLALAFIAGFALRTLFGPSFGFAEGLALYAVVFIVGVAYKSARSV